MELGLNLKLNVVAWRLPAGSDDSEGKRALDSTLEEPWGTVYIDGQILKERVL